MHKARLVLVHGRAQENKSEGALIEEWIAPLREALGDRAICLDQVEIRAPFYGNLLVELLASLSEPEPGDILVRGTDIYSNEDRYRTFMGEYVEVLRQREGIKDIQIASEAGIELIDRGPQNWLWVLATIRILNRIPGLDGNVIEHLLRDVWIYLERRTVRKEIDAIVAPAFDTDLPVVCIAHSLGTVIAYHILNERSFGSVPQLVTLGSPLGLDICRRALSPIRHPPVVGHWFNARDKRDVVALYPLDSAYFPIDPEISNNDGVRNRTANAHGISGYLNNSDVAGEIYRALSVLR